MMALGVIEILILLVLTAVVIRIWQQHGNRIWGIDWGKLLVIVMGVPLLMGGVLLLSYLQISHDPGVQAHQTQVAYASQAELARQSAEIARLEAELALTQGAELDGASIPRQIPVPPSPPAAPLQGYSDVASASEPSVEHVETSGYSEIQHLSAHGPTAPVASANGGTMGVLLLGVVLCLGVLGLIAKYDLRLALACLGTCVVLGLVFGATWSSISDRTVVTSPVFTTVTEASHDTGNNNFDAADAVDQLPPGRLGGTSSGSGSDAEMQPLQVREVIHHGFGSKTIADSEDLPDWVQQADGNSLLIPEREELILTSQRYSTIQEAEDHLKLIAKGMVADYMARSLPGTVVHRIDIDLFDDPEVLEKTCTITWPFRVGEYEDKVYQVAWKMNLGYDLQRKFRDRWRDIVVVQRLFILGGGLACITLCLGAAAYLTRRRLRLEIH